MKSWGALALTAALALAPNIAHANDVPPAVAKAAKQIKCLRADAESMVGPTNTGLLCSLKGRGKVYVLKYDSPKAGVKYWADWLDGREDGSSIVRKGSLLVVPYYYSDETATYVAKRLGGKVLAF